MAKKVKRKSRSRSARLKRKLRNLRKERDFKKRRYKPKFSLFNFLDNHKLEIILIIIGAVLIFAIKRLEPKKDERKEIDETVDSIIEERKNEFDKNYDLGHNLIVITNGSVIFTTDDSLSKEIDINWKEVSFSKIAANPFKGVPEQIKIVMPSLSYPKEGIKDFTLKRSFNREKGVEVILKEFEHSQLIIKIIEDYENKIFCVIGLKKVI